MIPFARILNYGNIVKKNKIKDLQCGQNHTGLLLDNGTFYIQGLSQLGQSGLNTSDDIVNFTFISNDVKLICMGFNSSIYISTSNRVYFTGAQVTINGVSSTITTWTDVTTTMFSGLNISNIKLVRLASDGIFVIMNDGSLYSKGQNTNSSVNSYGTNNWKLLFSSNVTDVQCGYESSYVVINKSIYVCGKNTNGQLGTGNTTTVTTHTLMVSGVVEQMFAGMYSSFYVASTGQLYGCGNQLNGQLGTGVTSGNQLTYKLLQNSNGTTKKLGLSFLFNTGNAYLDNGELMSTGNNAALGLGGASVSTFTKAVSKGGWIDLRMMANGLLVHDGENIYGAGNPRLLAGYGTGSTQTLLVKCKMPT